MFGLDEDIEAFTAEEAESRRIKRRILTNSCCSCPVPALFLCAERWLTRLGSYVFLDTLVVDWVLASLTGFATMGLNKAL